jgi:hypothetical protein
MTLLLPFDFSHTADQITNLVTVELSDWCNTMDFAY